MRAVYNNQEVPMFKQQSVWCPLEEFWGKLREVACSPEDFAIAVTSSIGGRSSVRPDDSDGKSDISVTSKEIEEEIAATLGKNIK